MKIAVIGAGSTYTPELVSGLSRERERLPIAELALHDIDDERREVVGAMAQRMLAKQGYDGKLELTGDLDRAVDGADFVLLQIRVGGQAARLRDETLPLACGCIGQETTGAGGLREGDAHRPGDPRDRRQGARAREDNAWIVDFTNPVGIVTRALRNGATAPSGCATWRSASNASSRRSSASSRSASSSTRSGSTTSPGCGTSGSTGRTSSPSRSRPAARRSRRSSTCPGRSSASWA